jgi:hypothetical protein
MTKLKKLSLVMTLACTVVLLTSCNLWSFMDSPSGDAQILSAARGCFDRGDYACATEYYQKLSSNANDAKISETIFVELAQAGFLSVADLVSSLGNGRGGGNSIVTIANLLAARGATTGANRTTIQAHFTSAGNITNANLRGYTKFMISLAMLSQTLASVVGADGQLTLSDMSNSTACRTDGTCIGNGNCGKGTSLLEDATGDTVTGMNSTTGWSSSPSLAKIIEAAEGADEGLTEMGVSTADGIFSTIDALSGIPGVDNCKRQTIIQTLFPN